MADNDLFSQSQEKIFSEIEDLKHLIPAMILLEDNEQERVALTAVIQRVLDKSIIRPFGITVLFCDFFFHVFIALGWRSVSFSRLNETITNGSFVLGEDHLERLLETMFYISTVYFVWRVMGEVLSTVIISWRILYANFYNFWALVDLVSIIMADVVIVLTLQDTDRLYSPDWFNFFALVTGFLWLKLLSFLKVVNPTLATFVLAIGQILKDVLLLLLIFLISVVAFADMFYLLNKTNSTTCPPGQDPQDGNPYCSGLRYLDMFAQILGQFDYGSFLENPLSIILFIIMTIFGAVIFLNILIAVVSDSYSTSCQKSTRLFGRARILTVAKINALEEIMQPKCCNREDTHFVGVAKFLFKLLSYACCIFTFVMYTYLINFIEGNRPSSASAIFATVLLLILYIGVFLLVTILITGWGTNHRYPRLKIIINNKLVVWLFWRPMVFTVYLAMGLVSIDPFHKHEDPDETFDEWAERLEHIDNAIYESTKRSESRLSEVVDSLETRMMSYEKESSENIANLKESLDSQKREIAQQRILLENILEKMAVFAK